jgi:hypothetical protein
MSSQTILIIRHADKPADVGPAGVDAEGANDDKSLTPFGWERAGVWAELFSPSLGGRSPIGQPTAVFASAPATEHERATGGGGSKSRRPVETVTATAGKLGLNLNLQFSKGDETALAAQLTKTPGLTLVCWQHEDIVAIVQAIAPKTAGIPAAWPGDRFNVVFRLQRDDEGAPWTFSQIVPVMLPGDSPSAIETP